MFDYVCLFFGKGNLREAILTPLSASRAQPATSASAASGPAASLRAAEPSSSASFEGVATEKPTPSFSDWLFGVFRFGQH